MRVAKELGQFFRKLYGGIGTVKAEIIPAIENGAGGWMLPTLYDPDPNQSFIRGLYSGFLVSVDRVDGQPENITYSSADRNSTVVFSSTGANTFAEPHAFFSAEAPRQFLFMGYKVPVTLEY